MDDQLIEASLQDFSKELQTALPLRHFAEYHGEEKLKLVTEQRRKCVMKNLFSKVWNRDKEEIVSLFKNLSSRMNKEVIAEWMKKNKEHEIQSMSYLQKRVEEICDGFSVSAEAHLQMNPDMELEQFKEYVDSRKLFAKSTFEGMWKPGDAKIQEDRRVKFEKQLKIVEEDAIEKWKLHQERKSVEERKNLLQEVKSIVLEKSRQLKCSVNDTQKRISNRRCHLKRSMEEIHEYLLNGKGCALRESHEEIYNKLKETVEGEMKFLTEQPGGNDVSREELIEWAERFDVKLRCYCFGNWNDQPEVVSKEADERDSTLQARWMTMQQVLKDEQSNFWGPQEPEEDTRNAQNSNIKKNGSHGDETDEMEQVHRKNKHDNDSESALASKKTGQRQSRRLIAAVMDKNLKKGDAFAKSAVSPPKKKRKAGRPKQDVSRQIMSNSNDTSRRQSSRRHFNSISTFPPSPSQKRNIRGKEKVVLDEETDAPEVFSLGPFQANSSSIADKTVQNEYQLRQGQVRKSRHHRKGAACFVKITILEGDPIMYRCDVCNKQFRSRTNVMQFHGEYCGSRRDKPFICKECGKAFRKKDHLTMHLRVHTKEKPFQCPKCPIRCSQRGILNKHIQCHDRATRFHCKTCNLSFVSPQGLYNHNRHNHKSKLPFACAYCTKRFDRVIALKEHVIVHSDERPFKCSRCVSLYALKKEFSRHIKRVHREPRHIAERLANEAAATYLSEETNKPLRDIPINRINELVVSHVIKKANLRLPDAASTRKNKGGLMGNP